MGKTFLGLREIITEFWLGCLLKEEKVFHTLFYMWRKLFPLSLFSVQQRLVVSFTAHCWSQCPPSFLLIFLYFKLKVVSDIFV